MELCGFEDVVVCFIREPYPGVVGEIGLDVLIVRGSELQDRILPINQISLGWWTDVEILLARYVDRGLICTLVTTS